MKLNRSRQSRSGHTTNCNHSFVLVKYLERKTSQDYDASSQKIIFSLSAPNYEKHVHNKLQIILTLPEILADCGHRASHGVYFRRDVP